MTEILKRYENNILDIVSNETVSLETEIVVGTTSDGKPIIKKVASIIEQRPERGTYKNENDRRNWAKIKL